MFYYDIWLCVSLYDSICFYIIYIYESVWLYMNYIWLISDCMWLYMIVYDYTWLYDCICMALLVLQWPIDHSTANYWWIVPMPGDGSCARVPNGSGPTKVGFRAPQAYDNHQLHFMQGASLHSMTLLMYRSWRYTPFLDLLAGTAGLLVVWTGWRVFDDKVCPLWPYWSYIAQNWTIATHCYQLIMLYCWLYMVFIICVPIQN